MKEIYKDIKGYEGLYQISNYGNVMSLNYLNTGKAKLLTPINHHTGYQFVHLRHNKIKMIHTLVAEAFLPKIEGKRIVNHIDGNKKNNRLDNLEYVTYKENTQHAIKLGIHNPHKINVPKGKYNVHSKPILQYTKDGKFIRRWECMSDAARSIGCNPCMLVNNASGRTKSAHGYVWKYPTDL